MNQLNREDYVQCSYWYTRGLSDEELPKIVRETIGDGGYRDWPVENRSLAFFPKTVAYHEATRNYVYVNASYPKLQDDYSKTLWAFNEASLQPSKLYFPESHLQDLCTFGPHLFVLDLNARSVWHLDPKAKNTLAQMEQRRLALPSSVGLSRSTRITAWTRNGTAVEALVWKSHTNELWWCKEVAGALQASPSSLGLPDDAWRTVELADVIADEKLGLFFVDRAAGTIYNRAWNSAEPEALVVGRSVGPRFGRAPNVRLIDPVSIAVFRLTGRAVSDQINVNFLSEAQNFPARLFKLRLLVCVDRGRTASGESAMVVTLDLERNEVLPLLGFSGQQMSTAKDDPRNKIPIKYNLLSNEVERKNKVLRGADGCLLVGELGTPDWKSLEPGYPRGHGKKPPSNT